MCMLCATCGPFGAPSHTIHDHHGMVHASPIYEIGIVCAVRIDIESKSTAANELMARFVAATVPNIPSQNLVN